MFPKFLSYFLVTILILNVCLKDTNALRCFVCGPDENCDRNFEDQTVNCGFSPVPNALRYECVKYHIGNSVARGCFVETFCQQQPYCYACGTDYCNGTDSVRLVSKFSLIISTIAILIAYKTIQ